MNLFLVFFTFPYEGICEWNLLQLVIKKYKFASISTCFVLFIIEWIWKLQNVQILPKFSFCVEKLS
jgi:hypothetical protein